MNGDTVDREWNTTLATGTILEGLEPEGTIVEEDATYDKVFLPSLKEINCVPQIEGEGNIHEYWKRRSGSATPLAQYGVYPQMITYAVENHLSAKLVRLRSANRSNAYSTWYVGSGYVGNNGVWSAQSFSPLIVIG